VFQVCPSPSSIKIYKTKQSRHMEWPINAPLSCIATRHFEISISWTSRKAQWHQNLPSIDHEKHGKHTTRPAVRKEPQNSTPPRPSHPQSLPTPSPNNRHRTEPRRLQARRKRHPAAVYSTPKSQPPPRFAGCIVTPASGSTLKPGQDRVRRDCQVTFTGGALADFLLLNGECNSVPEGVSPVDAASIGVAGISAYQSIVPYVKRGDKIFINGGSGELVFSGFKSRRAGC